MINKIKDIKIVVRLRRTTVYLMYNKWKGGRLKKRFNTYAQMNEQLIFSSLFNNDFPRVCWLSPEVDWYRFLRGSKLKLNCLKLLIGKQFN